MKDRKDTGYWVKRQGGRKEGREGALAWPKKKTRDAGGVGGQIRF